MAFGRLLVLAVLSCHVAAVVGTVADVNEVPAGELLVQELWSGPQAMGAVFRPFWVGPAKCVEVHYHLPTDTPCRCWPDWLTSI